MAKGKAKPKEAMFVKIQPRQIKAYSLTEDEVDSLGFLNSLGDVLFNLTTVFLGSTLGSITGLVSNSVSLISQLVFWVSLILFVVLGVITFIVTKRSKSQADNIKGKKKKGA